MFSVATSCPLLPAAPVALVSISSYRTRFATMRAATVLVGVGAVRVDGGRLAPTVSAGR